MNAGVWIDVARVVVLVGAHVLAVAIAKRIEARMQRRRLKVVMSPRNL